MTHMELLEALNRMTVDELLSEVTVYSRKDDKHYPVESMYVTASGPNGEAVKEWWMALETNDDA